MKKGSKIMDRKTMLGYWVTLVLGGFCAGAGLKVMYIYWLTLPWFIDGIVFVICGFLIICWAFPRCKQTMEVKQ